MSTSNISTQNSSKRSIPTKTSISEESDNQESDSQQTAPSTITRIESLPRINIARPMVVFSTECQTGPRTTLTQGTALTQRRLSVPQRPLARNISPPPKFRLSMLELFSLRMLPPILLLYLVVRISREVTQITYLITKLTGINPITKLLSLIGKIIVYSITNNLL